MANSFSGWTQGPFCLYSLFRVILTLEEVIGLHVQVKSLEVILEFLGPACFCWFPTYVLQFFFHSLLLSKYNYFGWCKQNFVVSSFSSAWGFRLESWTVSRKACTPGSGLYWKGHRLRTQRNMGSNPSSTQYLPDSVSPSAKWGETCMPSRLSWRVN